MRVLPISASSFKAGKIELSNININDLSNYDNIKLLAKNNMCDVLIEKKADIKNIPDYVVYHILARRHGITKRYIYEQDAATVSKNATKEEVSEKLFEAVNRASEILKKKSLKFAKKYL